MPRATLAQSQGRLKLPPISPSLAKALGIKGTPNEAKLYKPKAPPKKEPQSRRERIRQKIIDTADAEDRQYQRYLRARQYRLDQLLATSRPAKRFVAALHKLLETKSVHYVAPRDCDVDLADLATSVGLPAELPVYDRFLLLEEAAGMIKQVAPKRRRKIDDDDAPPYFVVPEPTALDDLKHALALH